MPKQWALDPHWEAEQACQQEVASHCREFPSQWTPVGLYRERNCNVRIIDHFKIEKRPGQTVEETPPPDLSKDKEEELVLPKVDSGQTDLLDLKANECIHCDKVGCVASKCMHIDPRTSITDYGEDITIDGGLTWCVGGEHAVIEKSESLEPAIIWSTEPSINLGNDPAISLIVEPAVPIYHDVHSQRDPDAATPLDHEPALWDSDVSAMLFDEPVERVSSRQDSAELNENAGLAADRNPVLSSEPHIRVHLFDKPVGSAELSEPVFPGDESFRAER